MKSEVLNGVKIELESINKKDPSKSKFHFGLPSNMFADKFAAWQLENAKEIQAVKDRIITQNL